jgi:hypothetical protein
MSLMKNNFPYTSCTAISQDILRRCKPGVIIVELHPHAMEETGYDGGALRLLEKVYEWGYTHVSHSG